MCELKVIENNIGQQLYVADIKADTIKKIIEYASLCNKIDYIYLFGSSLEERCKQNSDIDIALILNVVRSRLFRDKGFNLFINKLYSIDSKQDYDRLYFKSLEELQSRDEIVCKEIINKGKIIYKRKST